MGSFSLWHWVVVLVALGVPATIIGLVFWFIARVSRRANAAAPSQAPATPRPSTESRLQELDHLMSKDLISHAEYEKQRSAILQDI